jgi:hypothetical protein
MAGRGKPKWANVACPACGNEATLELVRRRDLARRLKCRCGTKRPARLQWIVGPPRRKPQWMRPRPAPAVKAARKISAELVDIALNDPLDDLWPAKEGPT